MLDTAVEQRDPVQVRTQDNIDSATEIVDDRERRKCNVVIYNAPESKAEGLFMQKKDDVSFVNE